MPLTTTPGEAPAILNDGSLGLQTIPTVGGAQVSGSNPLPVTLESGSVSIGTVAVSTDAQANAAAPSATEGAQAPLSMDLNRNLRVIEGSGTPVTGATMPAGGVGLTGWLSAIWSKIGGLLQANLYIGGSIAAATNPVPVFDAYQAPTTLAWTSATALNTAMTINTAGYDTAIFTIAASGTITAGSIIFEAYDGTNWVTIKAPRTDSYLTDTTFSLAGSPATHSWQLPVAGYPQVRARLSTAIAGTGTANLVSIVSSAPDVSLVTVGLDPSQPLPAGSNLIGSTTLYPATYTARSGVTAGIATAASVSAGGTGYAAGNTITLTDGTVLTVATISGSAVATLTITTPGTPATQPTNPVAQASTSGSGTGATFTMTYGPVATQVMAANAARTRGEFLNPNATLDLWYSTDGSTPSANHAGSKRAAAGGGGQDWTGGGAPTAAINVIGTAAFQPFTAAEA